MNRLDIVLMLLLMFVGWYLVCYRQRPRDLAFSNKSFEDKKRKK